VEKFRFGFGWSELGIQPGYVRCHQALPNPNRLYHDCIESALFFPSRHPATGQPALCILF